MAAVAEEEVRAVHSIHDLLADYEAAVDELLVGLAGCRERELQARAESQGLKLQLEKLKGIVVELPLGGESPTRSLASPLPSFISTRGTPTYTPLTPEAATRDSSLLATSDSSSYVMHTPDQRKSFIPPADQQSITPAAQQRTDLPGLPSSWTPSQDDDEPSVTPKRGWLGFILGSSPNPQAKKRMRG